MRKIGYLLIGLLVSQMAVAQSSESPQVPKRMTFADMQLVLSDGAQREIQKDVDALVKGMAYLMEKADRARLYMPLVEQVLKEEGVPEDFKYLAIQESAFVPDAVSVSNAVGFWQFKEPSGIEVGLRIDRQVDERMNIMSATRGACRYLKKFNETFDNWLFSLQAYNNGFAGAQRVLPESGYGRTTVRVTKDAHWYVKKYLAHRVAYQKHVEPRARPEKIYALYATSGGETIASLSRQLKVEEPQLRALNVWLKARRVPDDKSYQVVYPIINPSRQDLAALHPQEAETEPLELPEPSAHEQYPYIMADSRVSNQPFRISINGKGAIVAGRYDDLHTLASKAGMLPEKIRQYNDLARNQEVVPGQIYYLEKKRNRARVYYHTVAEGETLWQISQKYGVKLQKLLQKNRLENSREIETGMVLWLRFIRPADIPVQYAEDRGPTDPRVKHNEEMISAAMAFLDAEGPEVDIRLPGQTNTPDKLPPVIDRTPLVDPLSTQSQGAPVNPASETQEAATDNSIPEGLDSPGAETIVPAEQPMLYPAPGPEVAKDSVIQDPTQAEVVEPKDSLNQEPGNKLSDLSTAEVDWDMLAQSDTLVSVDSLSTEQVAAIAEETTDREEEILQTVIPESSGQEVAVPSFHKVLQGETLYSIARTYGLSVTEIASANQIQVNDPLKIDQELLIPVKSLNNEKNTTSNPTPSGNQVHEVQPGDTMYAIARQYGVRVEDLRAWNGKPDYTLKVGEKIIIKQ